MDLKNFQFNVEFTINSPFYITFLHIEHTPGYKNTHQVIVTRNILNSFKVSIIDTFRSSHQRWSIKKAVLKHFVMFTEKRRCWSLFLKKLQAFQTFRPTTLLKETKNSFFEERLRMAASACYRYSTQHATHYLSYFHNFEHRLASWNVFMYQPFLDTTRNNFQSFFGSLDLKSLLCHPRNPIGVRK